MAKYTDEQVQSAKDFINAGANGWLGLDGEGLANDDDAEQILDAGWLPDNTCVGFLTSGKFYCPECHEVLRPTEQIDARVYYVNVRPYSQTCHECNRLVVDGVKTNGTPVQLFEKKV